MNSLLELHYRSNAYCRGRFAKRKAKGVGRIIHEGFFPQYFPLLDELGVVFLSLFPVCLKQMKLPAVFLCLLLCLVAAPTAQAHTSSGDLFEATGIYKVRHADYFHDRTSTTETTLMQDGQEYTLDAGTPNIPSGTRVTVEGEMTEGAIEGEVVPADETDVSPDESSADPQPATAGLAGAANHSLAVILVNFSNSPTEPWTPAAVKSSIFTGTSSMANFYREQSGGQVDVVGKKDVAGDVFGWYTIAATSTTCNEDTIASQARNAANAAGNNVGAYDHVMYIFPKNSSCGWAGLAELPGEQSWINGTLSVGVTAHEMGHNMGVHHAASYRCTADGVRVALSSTCTTNEYGDPYDVMGNLGSRHSNNWHLQQLGYYQESDVNTLSQSGTYSLAPASVGAAGVQIIRIPRTVSGSTVSDYYDLEIREPNGVFDNFLSTSAVVNGVSIRMNPRVQDLKISRLIDANPSTTTFTDSPFAAGTTFTDSSKGITVTVDQASMLGAVVSVKMPTDLASEPDTEAPSVPTALTSSVTSGQLVLAWNASTDNLAVSGYQIFRDGAQIGTSALPAFTDTGAQAGVNYNYQVRAHDLAGNLSALSAPLSAGLPASIPPPGDSTSGNDSTSGDGSTSGDDSNTAPPPSADTIRPQPRILSPGKRSKFKKVITIRVAATDNRKVTRLVLLIDGKRKLVEKNSSLSYRWNTKRAKRGVHRLRVYAYDAAGNRGTAALKLKKL